MSSAAQPAVWLCNTQPTLLAFWQLLGSWSSWATMAFTLGALPKLLALHMYKKTVLL